MAPVSWGNILYFLLHCEIKNEYLLPDKAQTDRWITLFPTLEKYLLRDEDLNSWDNIYTISNYYQFCDEDFNLMELEKFVKNHFLSHPEILKRKNEHSRELIINVRRGDFYSQENINVYGFDIVNFVALCLHNLHEFDFESYVVYSDDIPWCKANLAALNVAGKELTYKNNLTPEEVFFDLASAKNIILSNSTFCYWAAYISTFLYGEKSIVLGPNFGNRKEGFYLPKQYLPQWHVIADFDYESPYK